MNTVLSLLMLLGLMLSGCSGQDGTQAVDVPAPTPAPVTVAPVVQTAPPADTPLPVVFLNSMGCVDPGCTDPAHFHHCAADCAAAEHWHSCPAGCTDPSHAHSGGNHHGESHHESHHG